MGVKILQESFQGYFSVFVSISAFLQISFNLFTSFTALRSGVDCLLLSKVICHKIKKNATV